MTVRAILWKEDAARVHGVRCVLCSHYCTIIENGSGRCRMRVNRNGILYSLSSDQIVAANVDPVEKKPLYHFLPGSLTFSLGTPGCNMTCAFCQNHALSQGSAPSFGSPADSLPPAFIEHVIGAARPGGAASVSFTYNEPVISAELIAGVAPRALDMGLATILVSNAYASRESMAALRYMISAANFDLKSFSDKFYRDVCGARLAPVLRTVTEAASFGWWVELTTLLIPGRNDSDTELRRIARFIKEDLGADVPWHISRFRPMYAMRNVPVTRVADLERARAIGLAEGLRFVYAGNVPGHEAENTYCPDCGEVFIRRAGYASVPPAGGFCARCGMIIPGVWERHDSGHGQQ